MVEAGAQHDLLSLDDDTAILSALITQSESSISHPDALSPAQRSTVSRMALTPETRSPSSSKRPFPRNFDQGHRMIAYRFPLSSTNRHAGALIELLQAPATTSVRLFATISDVSKAHRSDGPETNFPLMAALVEYRIPGISDAMSIVFDGVFLTAQRSQRAAEVGDVLDAAIASGKVTFGIKAAPFTSSLSPEEAITTLKGVATAELTEESRRTFRSMLSGPSEKDR